MPGLQKSFCGSDKFYARGIALYPADELYREMSFISYYFHWGQEEVLDMEHNVRRRWCEEISKINASLNPSNKKEKSIVELEAFRKR